MAQRLFPYNLASRLEDSAHLHLPAQDGPPDVNDVDPNDYCDWLLSRQRGRQRAPSPTLSRSRSHPSDPGLTSSHSTLSSDTVQTEPSTYHPLFVYTFARRAVPTALAHGPDSRTSASISTISLNHYLRVSRDSMILNVSYRLSHMTATAHP